MSTVTVFITAFMTTATAVVSLSDLVAPGAECEKVAGGFQFVEGPAWSPRGYLLFSDIPDSRIVMISVNGEPLSFLHPSGRANGLVFDAAGNLYACQGGARQVARVSLDGKLTPLASSCGGKKLNSPNDLALDGQGGIYFTDPRYGSTDGVEQDVMGVYYWSSGAVRRVVDDLRRPNGILVSSDGTRLYVAEPDERQLYLYPIESPGKLGKGKLIFTGDRELDRGGPDGMALDAQGNIYATYRGVTVLDPQGKLIGRIPIPENPANCTFGGKDRKTLFITARTSLYKLRMKVEGAPPRKFDGGEKGSREE